jgi:hypothetical protein
MIGEVVELCEKDALRAAHRLKQMVNPHKIDLGDVTIVLINVVSTTMTDDLDDHHETSHEMILDGIEIREDELTTIGNGNRVDELTTIATVGIEMLRMIETIIEEVYLRQTIQLPKLI